MLDSALKEQVKNIFAGLDARYVFDISVSPKHENREELLELLNDVMDCSDKLSSHVKEGTDLEFSLLKNGENTGVTFRGIPNGHEFTSLLLAILNSDGKGKNIPDETIRNRVKALKGTIKLTTYVSLTCTNCPEVVQALNLMAILNPRISHEMVDGAMYQDEIENLKIQGVPAVFAGKKMIHSGKAGFGELLTVLEAEFGIDQEKTTSVERQYDTIIIGGGPAGSAAAVYSARKGLKVALLAERIGGQVKETVEIENLISIPSITGDALSANLKQHVTIYPVEIFEHRRVEKVDIRGKEKRISTTARETWIAPTLIIATGANWRKLHVPGESEYTGHGVAFCPHCDGPFYANKHVAVAGGGNSGIEGAIDLAGICSKVTVFEFLDELKADRVLQEKVKSLPNVEIFTASQILEIFGDGEKVTGIRVRERHTGAERTIEVEGIFVQIGLTPNSGIFKEVVNTNAYGEIEIDTHCRTNQPGIYAAGDVSTVPYKQIIIAMGEGAKAALSAFEDRMKGEI